MKLKLPRVRKQILIVPYNNKVSVGNTLQSAIEIEDSDGMISNILFLCDGSRSISEIHKCICKKGYNVLEKEVEEVIDQISECPFIFEDAAYEKETRINKDLLNRYSRNLNFLSNFDEKGDQKYTYLERLINACIVVIGLGGVGSPLIYDLVALGVGTIVGVDFDEVDLTNLNRQILYRENHIGRRKIDAAGETIREFNSNVRFYPVYMEIQSEKDVLDIIEKYKPDCVICAADKPPIAINKWVNRACVKKEIPWIYGGNSETTSFYQVIIPHISACYECYEHYLKGLENPDGISKYKAILENGYCTQNNCTAASSSALASFIVFDALRIITKCSTPLALNKRMFIDYKTNTLEYEDVFREKGCEVCAEKGGYADED